MERFQTRVSPVSYGGILSCVCIAFPGLNKTSSRASAVDLSNEGGFLIVAGNGKRQVPLTQRNCSRSQVTQVPHLRSASVSAASQRPDAPGVLNSLLERQQDARPQSCGKNASTHLTYGSMRWKRLAYREETM